MIENKKTADRMVQTAHTDLYDAVRARYETQRLARYAPVIDDSFRSYDGKAFILRSWAPAANRS